MKVIAANLKANHTPRSTLAYLETLQSLLDSIPLNHLDIIVFPNQASLVDNTYKSFNIGVQNAYPAKNGAFTGEIGLEVLQSLKINHILLGHSERRLLLHESNAMICQKFDFFMQENMRIMLCIGENTDTKDVKGFLASQLDKILLSYPLLTIAYEPIWAIGSGKTPSFEDIANIVEILRSLGVQKVLYGGSVNIHNVAEICELTDGVLIGGASLEAKNFATMIKQIHE